MSILKELANFAEKQAEKRCIDKQIFVWAVICFCDFIRKNGYELNYVGKKKKAGKNERTTDISKSSAKSRDMPALGKQPVEQKH